MKKILFLFFLSGLLVTCTKKRMQRMDFGFGDKAVSFFEALPNEDMVELYLKTDFKKLLQEKENPAYQPAILTYADEYGQPFEWKIKIKPRGNMRRQICYYPPLKFKFSKKDLRYQGLKEIKTMKVAVGCQGQDLYQQLLLREFLAYKLYQILTERSFGVKLAKINIQDNEDKMKSYTSFAILIEHEKELAARLNGQTLSVNRFDQKVFADADYDQLCLFQFMIGNTDWHVANLHNLKLIGLDSSSKILPIAYDFDYAGIVNSPYAVPKKGLKITHVSERAYQGYCRSKEEIVQVTQPFKDKKEAIIHYCESFPHFTKTSRKYVMNYIESFYNIIETPRKTKRMLLKHCESVK